MRRLVAAELVKLHSTRSFWAVVAIALGLTAVFAILFAATVEIRSEDDLRSIVSTAGGGIMMLILGVIGTAGEYRHRTIAATFLIAPERWRVIVAKAAVAAVIGAVLGLVAQVLAAAIALPWLAAKDVSTTLSPGELALLGLGSSAYWAISGVFGAGLGAAFHNQVAAILLAVILYFVIEPTVAVASATVAMYLPGFASSALTGTSAPGSEVLDWWAGALVSLGYASVLMLAGTYVTERGGVTS